MKKKAMMTTVCIVMVLVMGFAGSASAESVTVTGPGPASVNLNFSIVIGSFVYFRVGTVEGLGPDTVTFTPSFADLTAGATLQSSLVEVELVSNVGNVTITQQRSGALDAAGANPSFENNISISNVVGAINPPNVQTGDGVQTDADPSGIINTTTTWQYQYDIDETNLPLYGTYDGAIEYTVLAP